MKKKNNGHCADKSQANLTSTQFKEKALPLHLNVTHTPPTIAEDSVPATEADPGHLAAVTLTPSVFSAGSYGWKGSRRLTIEVDGEDGKKEKVQVQLTYVPSILYLPSILRHTVV